MAPVGTTREQAEYLRLCLLLGLADVQAAIAWADGLILSLPEVPSQVIDVSLAVGGPAYEVADLLGRVPGGGDLGRAAHRVLGTFLEGFYAGGIETDHAVKMLGTYGFQAAVPEEERSEAANFPELLELVREGYWGSEDRVRRDLEEFLTTHAEV